MPLQPRDEQTAEKRTEKKTTPAAPTPATSDHSVRDDVSNHGPSAYGSPFHAAGNSHAGGSEQEHHSPTKTKKGEHVGFSKLSGQIEKKGYSKESADKIAASIGRKKYGAKKMAKMSAAGRK